MIEPGDTVKVNEDTKPPAIAGQVCTVLSQVAHYTGAKAFLVTVSHPHHNELEYLESELTLLQKAPKD